MIALATGLKLYYLVKTFMAFAMVICYAVLILAVYPDVFHNSYLEKEYQEIGMPLGAQMTILLVIFLTMVTYHARLVEVTSRLDFIWKEQAEKELANMKSNRFLNDVLIKVMRSSLVFASNLISPFFSFRTFFPITLPVTIYLKVDQKSCMPRCIRCAVLCLHRYQIFRTFTLRTLKMGKLAFEY